jgi:hypothetical protein
MQIRQLSKFTLIQHVDYVILGSTNSYIFFVSIHATCADIQIQRRVYRPCTATLCSLCANQCKKSKAMYTKKKLVGYQEPKYPEEKRASQYYHFFTGVPDALPACENSAMVAQKLLRLSLSKAALLPLTETMLVAALVDNPYK